MTEQKRELIATYTRKDFRVDTFRGTGPGGQHRNKTDSCVRITHIASGLVASACDHRSQHVNRKTAFHKLAEQIKRWHAAKDIAERPERVGETIRHYHGADNRVKDVASGQTFSYREIVEAGNIARALVAAHEANGERILRAQLRDHVE